jgi:signal transduction histidine kinase
VFTAYLRDITEHKRIEQERIELLERERLARLQAESANRSKDQFLATVSHELRTPLTAIRGHVDALRDGVVRGEGAEGASLEVIHAETERLARLVNDVLDLARLDAHRFQLTREEVDLRRLLERAYETYSEQARQRGIEYDRDFAADPVIETDGDRVLQIVSNLLENAFAWTPDGGRIALELAAFNGKVAVAVADTGPGIGPEERERIFRPFFTGDSSGTGLGLAIARELAHALGGDLALQSQPGHGSRFELRLPAT